MMKNTSKQSGVLATNLHRSEFRRAIFKLTAYYSLGVLIVLVIFSVIVYSLFINRLRFNEIEGVFSVNSSEEEEYESEPIDEEAQESLLQTLVFADVVLTGIIIILSYLLAKNTLRPIQLSYERQSKFVSDAAHELRTPLSVMKSGLQLALEGNRETPEYKKRISEALNEVDHMTESTNDLLFLARSNVVKKYTLVDLSNLCERAFNSIVAYAQQKQVILDKSIASGLVISANQTDIQRLVYNLLKNAIDYNTKNGSVSLSLSRQGNKVNLSVKDTGIGIPKEYLGRIFDRFFKIDSSRTTHTSGSGLGLSIVKEIADAHGAKLQVKSVEGKGSEFSVSFSS